MSHTKISAGVLSPLSLLKSRYSQLSFSFQSTDETEMSGPANIVNTLKSKIKETADELEKYEGISEETRAKYNTERKAREEIEAEVLSLNRKIKLMEDNMKRHEDRWGPTQIIIVFVIFHFFNHPE